MGFSLNTRKVGDVVVVDIAGRLIQGEPSALLCDTIRRYLAEGDRKFVLNLGGVSYMNAGGLGAFATVRKWMYEYDGEVNLLKLTTWVRQLLEITHLVKVFDCFDDQEERVLHQHGRTDRIYHHPQLDV